MRVQLKWRNMVMTLALVDHGILASDIFFWFRKAYMSSGVKFGKENPPERHVGLSSAISPHSLGDGQHGCIVDEVCQVNEVHQANQLNEGNQIHVHDKLTKYKAFEEICRCGLKVGFRQVHLHLIALIFL